MAVKKKIGILTLHRALNFGAVWQCYALKRACEMLGHEVETIDYNPFGHYTIKWAICHRPLVAYSYLMFMWQLGRFVSQRFNLTEHTESHAWIKNNPPKDDIYIVGSDTIWSNTIVGEYLDSYLLDFAPSNVRRISYAASTGGNPLELNEEELAELRKFSAISVREKQVVPNVQEKVDVPVVDVCDPTLLLTQDDYAQFEQKPCWLPKHYIVHSDIVGDSMCATVARQVSEQLNIPILNLAGTYKSWAKRNYLAPTPEQWLYIIHHADFVCTNSFHSVAFSVIYNRPFICCAATSGGRAKTNGRVLNLLAQTGFCHRYISELSQITDDLIKDTTDIERSAAKVENYRSRSLQWLKNAIEL